jgi:hypothetical protein
MNVSDLNKQTEHFDVAVMLHIRILENFGSILGRNTDYTEILIAFLSFHESSEILPRLRPYYSFPIAFPFQYLSLILTLDAI